MAKICVFCSATEGLPEKYTGPTRELGARLAQGNHHLVYGGSNLGLMGEVSRAFAEHSDQITEIIPKLWEGKSVGIGETIITKNIQGRLATMLDLSDGFITLPGGIGTMQEVYSALVALQISQYDKPFTLLNVDGFFDAHIAHLEKMTLEGFYKAENKRNAHITRTPEEAAEYIEQNLLSNFSPRR
jgi:uncharacterized protein (TIGR00730 family)